MYLTIWAEFGPHLGFRSICSTTFGRLSDTCGVQLFRSCMYIPEDLRAPPATTVRARGLPSLRHPSLDDSLPRSLPPARSLRRARDHHGSTGAHALRTTPSVALWHKLVCGGPESQACQDMDRRTTAGVGRGPRMPTTSVVGHRETSCSRSGVGRD